MKASVKKARGDWTTIEFDTQDELLVNLRARGLTNAKPSLFELKNPGPCSYATFVCWRMEIFLHDATIDDWHKLPII